MADHLYPWARFRVLLTGRATGHQQHRGNNPTDPDSSRFYASPHGDSDLHRGRV